VRLEEPSWWYSEHARGAAALLQPLASLYGWAAWTRYRRGVAYRSRLPVVCIGNFTAGGTGKTPLAIYLSQHLKATGHEPVVLTRGYGGRLAGPYWVDAGTDTARDVGDEALLLARVGPTHLARDRAAGAHAIESGPNPVTVIIMDDGLQNPGLAKDLAIAVVDGTRGLGNGLVMPAGPLRMPLELQLELTDAIVVTEAGTGAEGPVSDWLRHRFAGPVLRCAMVPAESTQWLVGTRVLAWAGIGAPQRFFAKLAGLGAELVEEVAFRDHQWLRDADAGRLLELAQRHRATLVTTEKDLARLQGTGSGRLAELAATTRVLPVKLSFGEPDAERLLSLIDAALKSRRG